MINKKEKTIPVPLRLTEKTKDAFQEIRAEEGRTHEGMMKYLLTLYAKQKAISENNAI